MDRLVESDIQTDDLESFHTMPQKSLMRVIRTTDVRTDLTYSANIILTLSFLQYTVSIASLAATCVPISSTTSDFSTSSAVFSEPTRSTAPEIPTYSTVAPFLKLKPK